MTHTRRAEIEYLLTYQWDALLFVQAKDAIRELLAEREWRPIETAPKDGSWVLVFDPKMEWPVSLGSYFNDGERDPRGRFKTGEWCLFEWDGMPSHCEPTHWRQLPEPPA